MLTLLNINIRLYQIDQIYKEIQESFVHSLIVYVTGDVLGKCERINYQEQFVSHGRLRW